MKATLILFTALILLTPLPDYAMAGGSVYGMLGDKTITPQDTVDTMTFMNEMLALEIGGSRWRLVGEWNRSEFSWDVLDILWDGDPWWDYHEIACGLRRIHKQGWAGVYGTLGVSRIHTNFDQPYVDDHFDVQHIRFSDDPFGFFGDAGVLLEGYHIRLLAEARYARATIDFGGVTYNVGGKYIRVGMGLYW